MQTITFRKKLIFVIINTLIVLMHSTQSTAGSTHKGCYKAVNDRTEDLPTIKLLMLGNSLMNGIQDKLTTLLECAGYHSDIVVYNPGGASLEGHNGSIRTDNLISEQFDIVLLQEYSSGIFANHDAPYTVIAQLKSKIDAAGSKMAFYQTWGYQPGNADEQIAGYDAVGALFNTPVFAIGRAWENYKAKNTDQTETLFSDDHHASYYGEALTSYTLFTYLTNQNPVNLHSLNLSDQEAKSLQESAWATYLNYH